MDRGLHQVALSHLPGRCPRASLPVSSHNWEWGHLPKGLTGWEFLNRVQDSRTKAPEAGRPGQAPFLPPTSPCDLERTVMSLKPGFLGCRASGILPLTA